MQAERASRVPGEEVSFAEDHVAISIQHPTVGKCSRIFHANSKMAEVYDWVGSLALEPEHFELISFNETFHPYSQVVSGVYHVKSCDDPLNLTENGTIAFSGFSVKTTEKNDSNAAYSSLQELRLSRSSTHTSLHSIEVDRENIYKQMINFFSSRKYKPMDKVNITFIEDDAVGDGITRDALTLFF